MDPMNAFLLAMHAAGLITSIFGAHQQQKTIRLGRQLEQEQFTTNMQAIKLQSAEGSLDEMKQVRQNIGAQIAVNAAKGNRAYYGGINETSNTFENDERRRRMNLLAKESELRAGNILSGLHTNMSETQLGQSLTKDIFNTLPISSAYDSWLKPKNKTQASTNATSNTGGFFNYGV